jgi:hypothetical protein
VTQLFERGFIGPLIKNANVIHAKKDLMPLLVERCPHAPFPHPKLHRLVTESAILFLSFLITIHNQTDAHERLALESLVYPDALLALAVVSGGDDV